MPPRHHARDGGRVRTFLFALGGALLVAEGVPALDVESGCRAAAKMGDSLGLDTTLRQCLADEKSAHEELEKQWSQFTLGLTVPMSLLAIFVALEMVGCADM